MNIDREFLTTYREILDFEPIWLDDFLHILQVKKFIASPLQEQVTSLSLQGQVTSLSELLDMRLNLPELSSPLNGITAKDGSTKACTSTTSKAPIRILEEDIWKSVPQTHTEVTSLSGPVVDNQGMT